VAEEKFTAVVVGAGPAGSTAAYTMAREGLDVLLIDRADSPGAKNMFGGRMYSYALNRVIPGFWEEAPLERPVVREAMVIVDGERVVTFTCQDEKWLKEPYHSFTLFRAEFDAWLAGKAEEAGALLACGIRVDDVLMKEGKVVGVRAGEDEILADVVIAADGANSLITEKTGLRKKVLAREVATGVKQVIELPPGAINERFNLAGDGGQASLYIGDCTKGMTGGGFLYTNKSSISLGLVIKASEFQDNQYRIVDLIEDFKVHPAIAPLIEGGEVVEYSAHLVPEGGMPMMPTLVSDGILVTGDAAGFVLNLGYQVRGMDLAIASGQAAAQAVLKAKSNNDFTKEGLKGYLDFLKQNLVLSGMEFYKEAPHFLENKRFYETYPSLISATFSEMFTVDGSPPVHLLGRFMSQLKMNGVGLGRLVGDIWKGVRVF